MVSGEAREHEERLTADGLHDTREHGERLLLRANDVWRSERIDCRCDIGEVQLELTGSVVGLAGNVQDSSATLKRNGMQLNYKTKTELCCQAQYCMARKSVSIISEIPVEDGLSTT